ncbi:MAG: ABC transporter permease [Gammaproteobacteria bacterium]|nr:ABC transporter permease [Gammaproteobacteria bacterium]
MMAVFRKELLENLRDRRVVVNTLLLGPLAAPLIFVAIIWFTVQQAIDRAEADLELVVVGAEHAPNLLRWLEQQGVVVKDALDDPEQAIREEQEEVILRIPQDFGAAWSSGRPAVVEVLTDRSRRYAGTSLARVEGLLQGYSRQIGQLRLQLRGVTPDLAQALRVQTVDLSTPESRGGMILAFLPYVVLITVFIGAMHMAIDTTSGERERRSLEPLLINPLPRWQIMGGKLLATTAFALATLGLGLIAFTWALKLLPTAQMDMALNLDWKVALTAFVLVLPVALLASGLLIILAAFAKSFREAQSYLGLVMFIPMIPSFWILINPSRLETWMTWVPLLSQSILILEMVRGETIEAVWMLTSFASTGALALLLAIIAGSLYNRPGLIFGDG